MLSGAISLLIGIACALALGAIFYGAMAYQLAGGEDGGARQTQAVQATPAPLAQGADAAAMYPGALLTLSDAQLVNETAEDVRMGGTLCRVATRTYTLEDGTQAEAVSAYPGAYLERLSQEGFTPQLITGFVLARLDAAYAVRGQEGMLVARDGERVYMIRCAADEQLAYALGAAAYLE